MSWLELFVVSLVALTCGAVVGDLLRDAYVDRGSRLRHAVKLVGWRLQRPAPDFADRSGWQCRLALWRERRPLRGGRR